MRVGVGVGGWRWHWHWLDPAPLPRVAPARRAVEPPLPASPSASRRPPALVHSAVPIGGRRFEGGRQPSRAPTIFIRASPLRAAALPDHLCPPRHSFLRPHRPPQARAPPLPSGSPSPAPASASASASAPPRPATGLHAQHAAPSALQPACAAPPSTPTRTRPRQSRLSVQRTARERDASEREAAVGSAPPDLGARAERKLEKKASPLTRPHTRARATPWLLRHKAPALLAPDVAPLRWSAYIRTPPCLIRHPPPPSPPSRPAGMSVAARPSLSLPPTGPHAPSAREGPSKSASGRPGVPLQSPYLSPPHPPP